MTGIFISYRREDEAGYTRALYDALADSFGKEQIFIDVETIDGGSEFTSDIDRAISDCEVVLVVIGKNWLGCSNERGRRLDQKDDFVRLEVIAALTRSDVAVIPVLVGGAAMPKNDELPLALAELPRRNAVSVDHDSFGNDAERLEDEIRKAAHLPSRRKKRLLGTAGLVGTVLVVVAALTYLVTDRIALLRAAADVDVLVEQLYARDEPFWAAKRARQNEPEVQLELVAIREAIEGLIALQGAPEARTTLAAAAGNRARAASESFEKRLAEAQTNEEANRLASQYLTLTLPSIGELLRAGNLAGADEALKRIQPAVDRLSDGARVAMLLSRLGYLHKDLAQGLTGAERTGDRDRHLVIARRRFEESLALEDDNPSAVNGIASVLILREDYVGAVRWTERAVQLLPTYLYAWHDQATSYFALARDARSEGDEAAGRQAIAGFRRAYAACRRLNGERQTGTAPGNVVERLERYSRWIDEYEGKLRSP